MHQLNRCSGSFFFICEDFKSWILWTYRKERFRMVLRRANCDRLDRSSWPFCPGSRWVWELALPSTVGSMFIEPAREFDFSIAAISNKQLKNDCFCWVQSTWILSPFFYCFVDHSIAPNVFYIFNFFLM